MKRLRVIAKAADTEFAFIREGANHEIWTIGDERLVIPRHRDINERTAAGIIKRAEEVTANDE